MAVVSEDKQVLDVHAVWLVVISIFVMSMVVLVLYHIILCGEVFHRYIAVVVGGSVGVILSASGWECRYKLEDVFKKF